jgi:hypothetical protein
MTYIVSHRANHDLKEISVTARDPEKSGCKVIDQNGRKFLRWNWLSAKSRPELNDWEIDYVNLSRGEARRLKAKVFKEYIDRGYTIRTVKHYEKQ